MTASPRLAVILVNYDNEEYTIPCLETLAEQTLDDVLTVVVDNGSDPASLAAVTERFDFPVYLRNEENLGFTGGNNRGIEYALDEGADWVLLLNNDTEVDPTFLSEFLAAADELPEDAGIVGPTIHTYETDEVWSAGGTLNRWTGATGSLDPAEQPDHPLSVPVVAGAALLVRDEVFRDIGLLDDDFFIYYEETEFCARARAAGWDVVYVPVEGVYHKETTTHTFSRFGEYYLVRNRLLFQQKTQPLYVRLLFYPYFVVRWFVLQIAYLLVTGEWAAARSVFKGGTDALRGRFGKNHPE